MAQNVFIIGATGGVGSTLVNQFYDKQDTNPQKHVNPTRVVGLARNSWFYYDPEGISAREADRFVRGKIGAEFYNLECLAHFPKDDEPVSFVDVTSLGQEMLSFHTEVIDRTPHNIVTANKTPLVLCDYATFGRLTSRPKRYGHRCSVMAGAEAVDFIRDLKDLGDPLIEIVSCLSGTLGYDTSGLEDGKKHSEIVREAFGLGYTESHPREDLSGYDVARKIFILVRDAGYDVPFDSINLRPFVPKRYLNEKDPQVFMKRIEELDDYFASKVSKAANQGKVLRYVARFRLIGGKPRIDVGLTAVQKDSPLGNLKGTYNKLIIRSGNYNSKPYITQAPGAGREITAQNIRRDLLGQLEDRVVS